MDQALHRSYQASLQRWIRPRRLPVVMILQVCISCSSGEDRQRKHVPDCHPVVYGRKNSPGSLRSCQHISRHACFKGSRSSNGRWRDVDFFDGVGAIPTGACLGFGALRGASKRETSPLARSRWAKGVTVDRFRCEDGSHVRGLRPGVTGRVPMAALHATFGRLASALFLQRHWQLDMSESGGHRYRRHGKIICAYPDTLRTRVCRLHRMAARMLVGSQSSQRKTHGTTAWTFPAS